MTRWIATLLCASLALTTPVIAVAQEADTAEFTSLTEQASEAYNSGDYDEAVRLFQKAYDLRPVSNILYNIGRIHEDAGNIDQAIEYYDKFVVAPNVEQVSRRDALDRLKTLREVKAMRDGESETETEVADTPQPDPQPEPEPEPNTARALGWVFLGVGGASLITSGVFALLTQSQFDKFEAAMDLESRRSAASAGRTNAVVSDALLVTGAVSAVVGIVFLVASGGGGEKDAATSTNIKLSPVMGSAWGVGLDFNF